MLAALGYLLGQLIQGHDRLTQTFELIEGRELEINDALTLPFIVVIGVAGLVALAAWWMLSGTATDSEALERAEEAERERERYEAEREPSGDPI